MTTNNSGIDRDAMIKRIAQQVLADLDGTVEISEESGLFIEKAVARLAYDFSASRPKVLNPDERELLIKAISINKSHFDADEQAEYHQYGSTGWENARDDDILHDFFNVNPAHDRIAAGTLYRGLTFKKTTAEECMVMLRMMARQEVMTLVGKLAQGDYPQWDESFNEAATLYMSTIDNVPDNSVAHLAIRQEAEQLERQIDDMLDDAMEMQETDAPAP